MVDLTMGSQGEVSGCVKNSQFEPLGKQNSMYNLTLDEVQNQLGDLGKPLSSMNLDELLQTVWTAEGNVPIATEPEGVAIMGSQSGGSLQRQASLSLTGTLSKKTVDEVWRDIQQSKGGEENKSRERQPTLGEITLEDFLVKAGVVSEPPVETETRGPVSDIGSPLQQPQQWMQYTRPSYQHSQQGVMGIYMPKQSLGQPLQAGSSAVMDVTHLDSQGVLSAPLMGTLSDTHMRARKRGAVPEEFIEKTVERRQKRMIKNRESAARSRARKQAYTNELEIKVSKLEEENERLRKQKELEKILHVTPVAEPKYQLRRTSSARL